jgi:hypothetical protein
LSSVLKFSIYKQRILGGEPRKLKLAGYPSPYFHKVLILKVDKVPYFDTLLKVLILKILRAIAET